nr:MAG TPA: hypothetical protein [Caudoviricetes sp.]
MADYRKPLSLILEIERLFDLWFIKYNHEMIFANQHKGRMETPTSRRRRTQ